MVQTYFPGPLVWTVKALRLSLVITVGVVLPQTSATAQVSSSLPSTYTRCAVPTKENFNAGDDCAPWSSNTNSARIINVQKSSGADPTYLVVAFPQRNCRPQMNQLMGGMSLVVDSSDSLLITDPTNDRLQPAEEFLRGVNNTTRTSTLPTTSPDYPKVGVVSYGGRVGQQDGYDTDGINVKVNASYCSDGDNLLPTYPEQGARDRWNEKINGIYYSVCEWLRPVSANVLGDASSTSPSLSRHIDFLNYTAKNPRGLTDLSYFYHAIKQPTMLGGLNTRAKNAIIITDGLPNLTVFVPEAECAKKDYLRNEDIIQVLDSKGNLARVCRDRRPRYAAKLVNDYIESQPDYSGINVYSVLFVAAGNAYNDLDDLGIINPADVLIEASSRTGNGKVKFKYARNKNDLNSYLQSLTTLFDGGSLQRYEVQVGTNPTYNAVSPAGFNKPFSVKLIGLKNGPNLVKVKAIYGDTEFVNTYTVNVDASTDSAFQCTPAASNQTVDGDALDEKNPKGDGVKPFPNSKLGQDRVYRNSDEENGKYSDKDFGQPEIKKPAASIQPQDLRLQGGTGNCGVVAAQRGNFPKWWLFSHWIFMMFGVPLIMIVGTRLRFGASPKKEKL